MRYGFLISVVIFILLPPAGYGEMYKWVDEKGAIHFTDDLSNIPEKFRPSVQLRNDFPRETSSPDPPLKSKPEQLPNAAEPKGIEIGLARKGELLVAEGLLNGRVRHPFIVDTGASYSVITQQAAKDLDLAIDETTPFIPVSTVSSIILVPLVTLRSLRVGNAEVPQVDVLVHNMPSSRDGLLGSTFLHHFKVVLDPIQGRMTLFPIQGKTSADRPGGYGRDYWVGRFRFNHWNLGELKKTKIQLEAKGPRSELNRVNNAIRYFENQLSELERKASFAGVPRNWRE
jgi:clan AA aspartic protease (TIGR02281 family)